MSRTDDERTSAPAADAPDLTPPRVRRLTRPSARTVVEIVLAAALLAVSGWCLYLAIRFRATTSLWTDELSSPLEYANRGPIEAITDYEKATNHIFFNLLNSVTPGTGSVDPLRVRIWSMVAVVSMLALGLYEFARRRAYLLGALFVALFAASAPWTTLALQARGYGLQAFFATAIGFWIWRYLDDRRDRWLVGIAVAVWLGTWTTPPFLLFAGPALLFLWLSVRNRRVFVAGFAAGLAIVACYASLVPAMREEIETFSTLWGEPFTGPDDVWASVRTYLMSDLGYIAAAVLLLSIAAVVVLVPRLLPVDPSVRALVRILLGATAVFYLASLAMRTAPLRTTAFIGGPLAICVLASAGALATVPGHRWIRRATVASVVAVSLVVGVNAVSVARSPAPVPEENWLGAVDYVESTYPPGTTVFATSKGGLLQAHLDGSHPYAKTFDPVAFAEGRQVTVGFQTATKDESYDEEMREADPNVVEIGIPQERGTAPAHTMRIQSVLPVAPDQRATVQGEPAPELTDGDITTIYTSVPQDELPVPLVIELDVPDGTLARSIVIAFADSKRLRSITFEAITGDGKPVRIPASSITRSGTGISALLPDVPIDAVRMSIGRSNLPPFQISEIRVIAESDG